MLVDECVLLLKLMKLLCTNTPIHLNTDSSFTTKMSTTTIVNWLFLPPELLTVIATNHEKLAEYIAMRAVCKTWRITLVPRKFPWILLNFNHSYNPLTETRHRLTLSETPNSCRCVGSSHGWLVLIESNSIFVINPLTLDKISPPPLSAFPEVVKFDPRLEEIILPRRKIKFSIPLISAYMRETLIRKVVLSHSPKHGSKFFALAILNEYGKLAYCQNGDDSWKTVHLTSDKTIKDAAYFNDAFYVVDNNGSITICELSDIDSPKVKFVTIMDYINCRDQYLVDGMGGLLLISRVDYIYTRYDSDDSDDDYWWLEERVEFTVFRLDMTEQKWVKITSLGEKVIFVGEMSTFALLARDCTKCEGNTIYYYKKQENDSSDGRIHRCLVGLCDLASGPTTSHHPVGYSSDHTPIWISPSL